MKNYNLGDKITVKIGYLDRKTFQEFFKTENVEIISYTVNIKDSTQKKYYKLSNGIFIGDIENAKAHGINTCNWIDIYTLKTR